MDTKNEYESSSSEDEICMNAIKQAADQDFLANLLNQGKEKNTVDSQDVLDAFSDSNKDPTFYPNHGLSQACRDFIAKKLSKKMNVDIILEDLCTANNTGKNLFRKSSGIKLFNCSNIKLTEIIYDEPKSAFKKKPLHKFDEKTHFLKCKEVALDSQTILSQQDLKYWTSRKHSQEFRYRKLKTGTLLKI